MADAKDELGSELLSHELKVDTVVALTANHRPGIFVTAWVKAVAADGAIFYSGVVDTTLIVRVNERGEMFDDVNHRIRAFQFREHPTPRVIARTFLRGEIVSEDLMRVHKTATDELIAQIAERHARACAAGTIDMVELEFLDEPDPADRFFRIGTNPDGMVMPIGIDLQKEKPS
jgi:hypothetical protein